MCTWKTSNRNLRRWYATNKYRPRWPETLNESNGDDSGELSFPYLYRVFWRDKKHRFVDESSNVYMPGEETGGCLQVWSKRNCRYHKVLHSEPKDLTHSIGRINNHFIVNLKKGTFYNNSTFHCGVWFRNNDKNFIRSLSTVNIYIYRDFQVL